MCELFCNSVQIGENFLECLVVGALELVEAGAEGVGQVLQLLNLRPLLELQETPQSLHHEGRLREVAVVDAAVVAHDKAAQLEGSLALGGVLAHHMRTQVHLHEQRLVGLEVLEGCWIILQVVMHNLYGPHSKLIVLLHGDYRY